MDTQDQNPYASQTPENYHSPGRSDILLPGRPTNPYTSMMQEPVPQIQQPQQKSSGLFDTLPYHKYLENNKNIPKPWEATNEELTGKHFDSYIDGPIKTLIRAQLAQRTPNSSEQTLDAHAQSIADALKIQKRSAVEDNIDALKAHLGTLNKQSTSAAAKENPYPGTASGAPEYDLIDNPITRGLAQGGNVLLGGLGYVGNKLGVPSLGTNPATGEAYAKEAAQLQAPKDAGLPAKLVQGVASIAGPAAAAGAAALSGGVVAGGLGYGLPSAFNTAAQKEAAGTPLSAGQVGGLAGAESLIGMIPLGIKGAGVIKNALRGGGIGIAGDVVSKAITGDLDKITPQDLEASGLTTAALSVLFHLPAGVKARLGAAIDRNKAKAAAGATPTGGANDLAAQAAGNGFTDSDGVFHKPGETYTDKSGQKWTPVDVSDHFVDNIAPKIDETTSPAELQQLHDEEANKLHPQQRGAFTGAFNDFLEGLHGDEAPQVKGVPNVTPETQPVQEGATAQQATAPENQAASGGVATETGVNPEHAQIVNDTLSQPIGAEVGTKKGQIGTGKLVPITFKNELDKLAYAYSKTKNEDARTALGLELQQRGVPASDLPTYVDAVSNYIKSTANALKHHVLASDIASKQDWYKKPESAKPEPITKVDTAALEALKKGNAGKKAPRR